MRNAVRKKYERCLINKVSKKQSEYIKLNSKFHTDDEIAIKLRMKKNLVISYRHKILGLFKNRSIRLRSGCIISDINQLNQELFALKSFNYQGSMFESYKSRISFIEEQIKLHHGIN